jgi:hypothetical protein
MDGLLLVLEAPEPGSVQPFQVQSTGVEARVLCFTILDTLQLHMARLECLMLLL